MRTLIVVVAAVVLLLGCYQGRFIHNMTAEEKVQMRRERAAQEEADARTRELARYREYPHSLIGKSAETAVRALGPPAGVVDLPGGGAVADFDMGPPVGSGLAHREKGLLALFGQIQASKARCVYRLELNDAAVVTSVNLIGGC